MKAFLVISHGSYSPKLLEEVVQLVKILQGKINFPICEYAFLEITQPDIPQGIKNCVDKGAKEITILLNFLNSGRHVNQDVPRIVGEMSKQYPHVKMTITKPIGQHPKIPELFTDYLS